MLMDAIQRLINILIIEFTNAISMKGKTLARELISVDAFRKADSMRV